jgi:hypothetical protein
MPRLPQIHDCKPFSFLIDEQVVGISRGEYYADFAHWFQRHDGFIQVDYSINRLLRFCPFCGEKLERLPSMFDVLHEDDKDEE